MRRTPLRDRFDGYMAGLSPPPSPPLYTMMLEAFMAGARSYDTIVSETAAETEDPEAIAAVLDAMTDEINNRHKRDS